MKPRERDIETYFKDEVDNADAHHRKVRWLDRRGAPDQFTFGWKGVRGPVALAEIKRPGEVLQAHQEREANRLIAAGVPYFVIDSFEAVDAFILEMTS